jgi:hypothetical protein
MFELLQILICFTSCTTFLRNELFMRQLMALYFNFVQSVGYRPEKEMSPNTPIAHPY